MILFLTDTDPDYAADYIAHGLCSLLGPQQVVDWPRKPGLHWQGEPEFDCNCNLETAIQSQDEVEQFLRDGSYDLVVVPTLRGVIPQRLYFWRELLRRNADRVVYVDGEDGASDTRPLFEQMANLAPAAYFKRELPLGETWAVPLPFGYPVERVQPLDGPRAIRGIYSAFLWDWVPQDGLRKQLALALADLQGFTVVSTTDYQRRVTVKHEHELSRKALVAVAPAGAGYHTNRHLSIIADGCCPVLEYPWRQWPDAPVDGIECCYFKSVVECVDMVASLIDEPSRAREMAAAAQRWLLAGHTTKHRALTVWDSVHGKGVDRVGLQAQGTIR